MAVDIPVRVSYQDAQLNKLRTDATRVQREQQKIIREGNATLNSFKKAEERINRAVLKQEKEKARLMREQVKHTREQIRNHKQVLSLTKKLDKELAGQQRGGAAGGRGGMMSMLGGLGGLSGRAMLGAGAVGAAAGGATLLAQQAIDASNLASEFQKTDTALRNLTGSAESFQAVMVATDRASKGRINVIEQQRIANQLFGMQLVENADDVERFITASRRLGGTFKGLGTKEAAEEFALLMANMSYPRLDSFGLSSARVKRRVDELMKSTSGMNKEAAFFQAVMEEAEGTLDRLGEEVETNQDRQDKLNSSFEDAKIAAGGFINVFSAPGATAVTDWLVKVAEGAEAAFQGLTPVAEQLVNVGKAADQVQEGGFGQWLDETSDSIAETNPILFGGTAALIDYGRALFFTGDAAQQYRDIQEELQNQTEETTDAIQKFRDNLPGKSESTGPTEEFLGLMKKTARELIDIDEDTAEARQEAQDEWLQGHQDNLEEHLEAEADIWEDYNKTVDKITKDLGKNQGKTNKKLAKDLLKLNKDLDKDISKVKKDAAKQATRERRREQIDALGDERLFQFELRQMAAEGDAAGISAALERREIEKQIEAEKKTEQAQERQQDIRDEIQELRDAAQERKVELQSEHRERMAELNAEADEARQLAAERRDEELEEERLANIERVEENRKAKVERLKIIDEERNEALQILAEQFHEMEDKTLQELNMMDALWRRKGSEHAAIYSQSAKDTLALNKVVGDLIGSSSGYLPATAIYQGSNPEGYQFGGGFTVGGSGGPDSQMVSFPASPGERVTISPQITNNVNGGGMEKLVELMNVRITRAIDSALQEYTDEILVGALN